MKHILEKVEVAIKNMSKNATLIAVIPVCLMTVPLMILTLQSVCMNYVG